MRRHLEPELRDGYRRVAPFGFLIVLSLLFLFRGVLDVLLTPVYVLNNAAYWFIRLWI